MASRGLRLFQTLRIRAPGQVRGISTQAAGSQKKAGLALAGTLLAGGVGYGLYKNITKETLQEVKDVSKALVPGVSAASGPTAQPSVYSQGKNHALYLWIELKPNANPKDVAKVAAKLQKFVDQVSDPSLRDEDDEIWAGVGFGPNFWKKVGGNAKDYTYAYRKGSKGEMPSSDGDVFVHAKCNTPSKLFELAQVFVSSLPADSIKNYEDIYSFVYKNGRDLSGFIDGTENAADDDNRKRIAVEQETGGSYVITQKWLHDLDLISKQKDATLESWVGRTRADSVELKRKSISSHVARMTGGNGFEQKKPFEIVRQSMPFGSLKDGAGLFFIGYAASPENHNFMLDMMVGARGDTHCDDIMNLSKNVKGTYWYFPGQEQLSKLA